MKKYGILILTLAAILIIVVFSRYYRTDAVRCGALLSRNSVLVADRVKYSVYAASGKAAAVDIPEVEDNLSGFDIVDKGISETERFGRIRTERWYLIARYQAGSYVIPAVWVRYKNRNGLWSVVETNEVLLKVKSVVGDKIKKDFSVEIGGPGPLSAKISAEKDGDIASAVPSRRIDTPIWAKIVEPVGPLVVFATSEMTIAVASLAVFVLFILLIARLMQKRKKVETQTLSPYELALTRLTELEGEKLLQKNMFKEFYFELSVIVRDYIRVVLNMGSRELTTAQFVGEIGRITSLKEAHKKEMESFFSLCDLIKFSGYEPEKEEIEENLNLAKRLIGDINASMMPEEVKV